MSLVNLSVLHQYEQVKENFSTFSPIFRKLRMKRTKVKSLYYKLDFPFSRFCILSSIAKAYASHHRTSCGFLLHTNVGGKCRPTECCCPADF